MRNPTQKESLELLVSEINKLTNQKQEPWKHNADGKCIANTGTYFLKYTPLAEVLCCCMVNEGGKVSYPFSAFPTTKYNMIKSLSLFAKGLKCGRQTMKEEIESCIKYLIV